jgi:hypothetical protein
MIPGVCCNFGSALEFQRSWLSTVVMNSISVVRFFGCFALVASPLAAETRIHTPASIPAHGGGAALAAKLFAPDPAVWTGPYPVITMLPGGGAGIESVEWAAIRLAEAGYVSIITLPASGGSTASYNAAARSGLDFLASPANPFLAECDLSRVGACGWSLGARSLTRTQEEDTRIDCLVAWDNLALSENGDAGSPSGAGSGLPLRMPRVPAMGQASEMGEAVSTHKLTAFHHWRASGVPAAQISLAIGSTVAAHLKWGTAGSDAEHDLFHYYTQAWFDRWLKNDAGGIARLTAPQVLGSPAAERLSTTFLSGLFADGIDTSDLRAWSLAASGNLAPRTFAPSATDPAITSFNSPHHAFFNPATPARGRLFLFLPGTDATPSVYQKICRHAAVLGWHSLGLMYQNGDAVNALCPSDPQCAGLVRAEVLDGIDRTPLVNVDAANSITNRLVKALLYLAQVAPTEGWGQFLDASHAPRWERIVVAGHSQGGGHAAFIAKTHAVSRCLMFASADTVANGDAATWMVEPGATPPERFFGLAHLGDPLIPPAAQRTGWTALGMDAFGPEVFVDTAPALGGTRRYMTALNPALSGLTANHGVPAVDFRTPLMADGQPALSRVWTAMLTEPLQPPALQIERTPSGVRLAIPATDGLFYILQQSADLGAWTQAAPTVIGAGQTLEWAAPIDPPHKFWRVLAR